MFSIPGDQQEGGLHHQYRDQGGQEIRVRGGGVHPEQTVHGRESIPNKQYTVGSLSLTNSTRYGVHT